MGKHGFISKYAVCPYYRKNDTNRICCEGVEDNNVVHLVFGTPQEWRAYEERFCNSMENYNKCKLCQMLDRKWSEEDNAEILQPKDIYL